MTWRTLARYVQSLEDSGELIRVADPVDVELELVASLTGS